MNSTERKLEYGNKIDGRFGEKRKDPALKPRTPEREQQLLLG
jgi:hypothetical protein